MYFDGSRCKHGCGAEVVFKHLKGHMKRLSLIFTYICTNNVAKYEALYFVLSKAISIGIRCLIIYGDLELVIKHVKNQISAKHHYLKTYKNRV